MSSEMRKRHLLGPLEDEFTAQPDVYSEQWMIPASRGTPTNGSGVPKKQNVIGIVGENVHSKQSVFSPLDNKDGTRFIEDRDPGYGLADALDRDTVDTAPV